MKRYESALLLRSKRRKLFKLPSQVFVQCIECSLSANQIVFSESLLSTVQSGAVLKKRSVTGFPLSQRTEKVVKPLTPSFPPAPPAPPPPAPSPPPPPPAPPAITTFCRQEHWHTHLVKQAEAFANESPLETCHAATLAPGGVHGCW